jgi:transcriptional regulator with XRE-family HTH domain
MAMNFGEKIRELRKAKNLTLRELAVKVKVNFTYLSKIENQKLSFGEFPSEDMIRKLAKVLNGDVDELLILAEKMPKEIKKRVMERPDAFRKIAKLDDEALDKLLEELDENQ